MRFSVDRWVFSPESTTAIMRPPAIRSHLGWKKSNTALKKRATPHGNKFAGIAWCYTSFQGQGHPKYYCEQCYVSLTSHFRTPAMVLLVVFFFCTVFLKSQHVALEWYAYVHCTRNVGASGHRTQTNLSPLNVPNVPRIIKYKTKNIIIMWVSQNWEPPPR